VALMAGPAQAQQTSWTGANSPDWSYPGNWTNGVPSPGDIVVLNAITPHGPNIGPGVVGKALDLRVGASTAGTLVVLGSGDLESGTASVGDSAFGVVTVTDSGSTWTNSSYLFVGEHGTGRLNIKDGGTVTTDGNASIGRDSGSVGTTTVTGLGSTWTTDGFLRIGDLTGSQGALEIADQGVVTSNSQVRIADASGTQGTVLVTGAGSKWQGATQFHVGFKDEGSLTIADGGDVSSGFSTLGTWGSDTLGTATVTGTGSSWTISGGVLIVGQYGRGVLAIADSATVSSAGATLGSEEGSSGGVTVIGPGSTWTNTGDLDVGRESVGTLRIDAGGSVVNTNGYIGKGAGSTGAAVVVGIGSTWTNSGDLYVGDGGDGTLIIGPSATASATGVVSVADQPGSSGLIVVNGDLVGTGVVDINTGGRLEGVGTVTGNINVGGTIAPGNSIGTLHVVGPYTQAAGSTYEVEINAAGNSDLIDVTGAATLNGGTVEVVPFPDFALATPYTILTATGGVTGTFDAAAMGFSSAFLTPQLTYGTNDVTFTIAQTASFASAALTPNQEAAAQGADGLGAGNPIWDAIALLPSASAAPAAFDVISGEVHASAASVLIEDSRFVREAIDARLRAAFAGVGASATSVLAYGDEGPEAAPADTDRFAAWGHAFGSWGEWDSDGNAASLIRDTGGFVLGGDVAVTDTWRLGLLAGYSSSNFDIDDRASSGSAESYHLGAYAGTEIGKWGLRFGGAYSWHAIDTVRTAAFPGFTDTLSAEYDAATAQIFGEAAVPRVRRTSLQARCDVCLPAFRGYHDEFPPP
jgi:outer membrane autotransporter protein